MEGANSERYLKEILEQLKSQESRYEEYLSKTKELYEGERKEARRSTWLNFIFYITIIAIGVFVGGFILLAVTVR